MKAWLVCDDLEPAAEIVLAETRGKALFGSEVYAERGPGDLTGLRVTRLPALDGREGPVTWQWYLEVGYGVWCRCGAVVYSDDPYEVVGGTPLCIDCYEHGLLPAWVRQEIDRLVPLSKEGD